MGIINKIKSKIKSNALFSKMFSFESGIDITNDDEVLYRKNKVIKNIIFVSNLIYTLIFTLISFTDSSNWILTIILFPVTFIVNKFLSDLIKKGPKDKMSQSIAMYLACAYMFLSAVTIYVKLKFGSADYLKEVGYILIYYSMAICAYYQDKKLLKNIFWMVLALLTVLHFTLTYPIISSEIATDISKIGDIFTMDAIKDILIRTIIFILYWLVLYVNVLMVNFMQEERKKELIKRRKVQEDFTNVVTKIFDVTLDNRNFDADEENLTIVLSNMVNKLAQLSSLKPDECKRIYDYSRIHIDKSVHFAEQNFENEDEKFEALRSETELGSKLISRLQLKRECEDIIRKTFEKAVDEAFVRRIKATIKDDVDAQIILICDIYVTMRAIKSYKKAYSHSKTMEYFNDYYKVYFDYEILERFVKFASDFEEIYDNI